ncbi:hypothetical protein Tco_0827632 [Tanacetum coccineum]
MRNKPPTRAQQRSIMCTYLKNMAGWKPKYLKNKSFANIQELFDKAFKRVNTFVDFRTELVEGTKMEESSKKAEVMEESSSKRAGDELEQENAKKHKMDDDQEAAKMKELIKIVPDEEEVTVDAIPLATKPPSIMLRSFDREDLETLWKLVKAKHGYTRPDEGYERVLWGDLKTMFEHHVKDAGRIVGIKRLLDDLRVTAAKVLVTAAKHKLVFGINKSSKELCESLEAEDASSNKFLVSNFTNYKMTDSRPVMEKYNELLGILGRFTHHKMNMDEAIQVSCIIDKLPPCWKDFKHTLKHLKDELTLVELGSHLRIKESLRV